MNTLETTKEVLDEFDIWIEQILEDNKVIGKISNDAVVTKVHNLIKNSHIKILQNEIGRLEDKKLLEVYMPGSRYTLDWKKGFNKAIEDQIIHYKEQIELIKTI